MQYNQNATKCNMFMASLFGRRIAHRQQELVYTLHTYIWYIFIFEFEFEHKILRTTTQSTVWCEVSALLRMWCYGSIYLYMYQYLYIYVYMYILYTHKAQPYDHSNKTNSNFSGLIRTRAHKFAFQYNYCRYNYYYCSYSNLVRVSWLE